MTNLDPARRKAAELISKNRLTSPPVDAERIARLEKVSVLYAGLNDEVKDKVSAYAEPNRVIYVNRDQPPEHKNYAIAHELGHLLLHPSYVESSKYQLLLRNTFVGAGKSNEEKEAEAFAAELLVPRKLLDRFRSKDPESLASLFVAPIEVIRAQLGPPLS
ncbi:MAG: ImmA/IrrE family metallo-endopeptidase [Alphaproteobacteria bacterium]|nr:MAG: ImmA/IrrE family metallo-endopeptidase [Alphaproteobacteria bacterium]